MCARARGGPNALALEILSGEPALTVIPNLLVTGVLAVVVGLAVLAWSIWFAARSYGGLVLIVLSGLLLLVGGGLAPPSWASSWAPSRSA